MYGDHGENHPVYIEKELDPGKHTRILVGNFDLANLDMTVKLLDLDENIKYETKFSNNPNSGEEEEGSRQGSQAEYPGSELDDNEEME